MGIYKNKPGLQDFMKKINNEKVKGSLDQQISNDDWVPYGDTTASYYVQWDSDISGAVGNYVGTFATAGGVQPS